jgi:CheY-like chemotaxis protein
MKVLVCDDDAACRVIIKKLVEGYFRCEVSECTNGADALALLSRDTYAFMFLDLTMPVMDGAEALKQIRESPATKDLPVIILSGENDAEAITKVMQLGIADYMLKPPRTQAILSKVEKVLRALPK